MIDDLTLRAEMRATAGDAGFDDQGLTTRARQTFLAKNTGKFYVTSLLAFGVDVVAVSAAAFFDR